MRRANPPSRREKPEAAKKILLGGVFPAGDMVKAAELRYAAESLRRVFPKAELHIAGENGVPAYGFPGGVPVEQLRETIRQYDAFGWIGTPVSGGELMPGAEPAGVRVASRGGRVCVGHRPRTGCDGGKRSRARKGRSVFPAGEAGGALLFPAVRRTEAGPGPSLPGARFAYLPVRGCCGCAVSGRAAPVSARHQWNCPAPIRCCWPRRRCCRRMSS